MNISSLPSPQLPQADAAMKAQSLHKAKDKNSVHEAAKNFEALFMNEMVSYMFEGVGEANEFNGGKGEEVFRSLMVEQYSKKIADSGQTKIAASLEKTMLQMQEQQRNPNKPIHAAGGHHA